jgi:hypothetical protein
MATRAAILVACAFLFGGCFGTSNDRAATTKPTVTPEFLRAAEQAARDAVLLLEDAPAGWKSEPDEPPTPAEKRPKLSPACTFGDASEQALPGHVVFLNGEALFASDRRGPEINSEVNVFGDEETARQTFEQFSRFWQDCRGELVGAFKTQVANDPQGETVDDYGISDLDLSAGHANAFGVRVSGKLSSSSLVVDFVTIRRGRILSTLAVGAARFYDDEREKYLKILEQRAERADSSLP